MNSRAAAKASALAVLEVEIQRLNAFNPWIANVAAANFPQRGHWDVGGGSDREKVGVSKGFYDVSVN